MNWFIAVSIVKLHACSTSPPQTIATMSFRKYFDNGLAIIFIVSLTLNMSTAFVPPATTGKTAPTHQCEKIRLTSIQHPSAFICTALSSSAAHHDRIPIHDKYFSFDEMKAMEARLGNIEKEAPDMLTSFYEPHLKSFSVRPGSVQVRRRTRRLEYCSVSFAHILHSSKLHLFTTIRVFQ